MGSEEVKTEGQTDFQEAVESIDDLKDETGDVDLEEFGEDTGEGEDVTDTTPKDDSSKPEDKTKPEEKEWDKERQRADQAEANFRKTQQEKDALEAKAENAANEVKELKGKLAELTKVEDVDLSEIDETVTDPKIIAAIKSLQAQTKAAIARAEKLEQAKDDFEQRLQKDSIEQARELRKQEIVADIEADGFSSKYRNEAIKMANEICEKRGFSPKDSYEAAKMLRQCYKDLQEADKKKGSPKPPKVPTDTGKGSSSSVVQTETNKPCSLRQAAKELRQKLKIG